MRINTVIIDDDPIYCEIAGKFAHRIEQLNVVGSFDNPFKAQESLREGGIDLIISDIEMPSMNGFELIKSFASPPLFIFMTAHREFAAETYELDGVDYLVKPFTFDRFHKAVSKALELTKSRDKAAQLNIPSSPDNYRSESDHFFVRTDSQFQKIFFHDVLFFEAMKDFVKIFTEKGTFIAYITLKILEDQLPTSQFLRTHRSYIINSAKVDAISPSEVKIESHVIPLGHLFKDRIFEQLVEHKLIKR